MTNHSRLWQHSGPTDPSSSTLRGMSEDLCHLHPPLPSLCPFLYLIPSLSHLSPFPLPSLSVSPTFIWCSPLFTSLSLSAHFLLFHFVFTIDQILLTEVTMPHTCFNLRYLTGKYQTCHVNYQSAKYMYCSLVAAQKWPTKGNA